MSIPLSAPEPMEHEPESEAPAAWVQQAGVSQELIVEDRAPRLHWALFVLGPLGLALAVALSMWSSSQSIQHSVDVQVDSEWQVGDRLALRTQVFGGDLRPDAAPLSVDAELLDAAGTHHPLGALVEVGPGLAQTEVEVPNATRGPAELHLRYRAGEGTPFQEVVPLEVVDARAATVGRHVVAGSSLQWGDDTEAQPDGLRIDLRFAGRVVAGFRNRVFVRVTDVAGKPWVPVDRPAWVQVRLMGGEWDGSKGSAEAPPVVHQGPLDRFGLADFAGVLTSEVVRFEVRLTAAPPVVDPPAAPSFNGPRRALRFVSHAGTVYIHASTDFAWPGDEVTVEVEAISARKPVFIDVHSPTGGWIATFTPPLTVPQTNKWAIPTEIGEGLLQLEGYQSVASPEQSAALAQIQISTLAPGDPRSLAPLIARQREQLALPRVDKQFEVERERVYLQAFDGASLTANEVARARSFLIGSLEPVVHGPPVVLDTRAREEQTLAEFHRRWVLGIRWFLLGGGGLYIAFIAGLVWRHQQQFEAQSNRALGLVGEGVDEETQADQSLALVRARQQIIVRGAVGIGLMIAALIGTLMLLESLVWV